MTGQALVHVVVSGLATGSIYALMAISLVIIYNATRTLNFAQGEMLMISTFVGWTAWLDIAPEGVDKSTGLKVALAQYDLQAQDLLAMGDGRNDIEMLTYAGLGIAMGTAPDEVKAAADEVTKSVQDDGVAAVLARWF